MKDRRLVVKEFVLEAIANDYEDLQIILREVSSWAGDLGIAVTRQEVLAALEELIGEGDALAYQLSAGPPAKAEPVGYSLERVQDLWFYITPRGKLVVSRLESEGGAAEAGNAGDKPSGRSS